MTKEREQFEKDFALTAIDPGSWLEQAEGMRVAAMPVLQSLLGIIEDPQTRPGVRLQKLAYVRAYMLLSGFAFENLLKAIAVARGFLKRSRPRLQFDDRLTCKKGGHSLTGLARDLQLELTSREQQYLERLEEYIHWAGRYPVSMKPEVYADSYSARRLSFTTDDPMIGDALFDKLSNFVKSSA